MKIKLFLFILIIFFLVGCGNKIDSNMSATMGDFEFITQDEQTLSLEDLKGKWWIANFMYTNCRTICPRTTAHLADVQKKLQIDGLNPHIVSFSVDPSHDTPEVLSEYANEYDADLNSWNFLTGYNFETIQTLSESSFRSALKEGAVGQRSHGYGFYLINPDGEIIKKYDGMSSEELDILIEDVKRIL